MEHTAVIVTTGTGSASTSSTDGGHLASNTWTFATIDGLKPQWLAGYLIPPASTVNVRTKCKAGKRNSSNSEVEESRGR
jgi:hypothetical protein